MHEPMTTIHIFVWMYDKLCTQVMCPAEDIQQEALTNSPAECNHRTEPLSYVERAAVFVTGAMLLLGLSL